MLPTGCYIRLSSKGTAMRLFDLLAHREGIPDTLISDQARGDNGPNEKEGPTGSVHYKSANLTALSKSCRGRNKRDETRREAQRMVKASPMKLWDYCAELQCEIVRIQPLICMRSAD
jgi:hypothetical protein